jgi:hypothetical protein
VCKISFTHFTEFINFLSAWANIFLLLFYSTAFEATQDLHVQPMHWDERYEPFICLVGFLQLARLVNRGLSLMDAAALMALMDRWRPEAHTFHVPPSIRQDRNDPWSSHRRHSCLWDGVFYRVEGLRRTSDWPSTPLPQRPRGSEGQEDDERVFQVAHSSLQYLPGGC